MDFGKAIEALKAGKKVARAGWNGKGMYLALQTGSTFLSENARGGVAKTLAEAGEEEITLLPHIDMKTATGEVCVGWLASQTDMLADDWSIVDQCSECDACPPTDIIPPCNGAREGFEG